MEMVSCFWFLAALVDSIFTVESTRSLSWSTLPYLKGDKCRGYLLEDDLMTPP